MKIARKLGMALFAAATMSSVAMAGSLQPILEDEGTIGVWQQFLALFGL